MHRPATLLLALSMAWPAQAQPDPAWLPQASPAGSARLTVWGFEVYDARLWVTPGFRRRDLDTHAFALELTYRRAFRAADIARRSLAEMARTGPIAPPLARRWEDQLGQLLPDVQEGDRLLGLHRPGQGAEYFHNGRRLGAVADAEFARRFFAIWLGPASSEPALRDALLAGTAP
ncbi:MAG TPA: chalcone isomerase family protein [Ramlibacter sp.]|jgi:hypothetical protein|uniref:chalcone isomerase family protein n=1 Tax=Ramlibacter sp. TaxID=1917967 RepID=UPI002D3F0CE2|nr:chalcone isomerase family protein [Ramlibacter sp.]HZY17128.1 chalcone isomerase family protein [Ramlibacter sp.]